MLSLVSGSKPIYELELMWKVSLQVEYEQECHITDGDRGAQARLLQWAEVQHDSFYTADKTQKLAG
jgi:hypothetical protein